ncbi:RNA polymerase sigma factor SigZ [Leisingera sp. ANG-M7]|uniref:RNA polymerase sigma factor SigZ n=1 Tax=Leisingera sp. ANG-M7 TaxID=1577902 RepID=UPI00057FE465|nr:RNA polymerase sigma factor SigZ [Leisingera sp. ANG-M7]KIC35509.1 RNA polymerase sigma factor SigZ [Leisingera sp. ANG-M7]
MTIEDIWPQYRSRLRAFLRSRVSNPEDAEDLLQEISIKVFTGLPALEDSAKLKPWLFQTAQRTIIDHYRKGARAKSVHPDDLWYTSDDPAVRQDLEHCVEPFIQSLPAETARMLTAIDLQGMSQQNYADQQGLPYSTLKSRLQKGRKELRKAFEDCCNFSLDARGSIAEYDQKSDTCRKC